jgi:3-phenylpropionate/cinnamic acid dioxygenase small subunit
VSDPRDFIVHEADLLDQRRFTKWLALFSQDGHYWVPLLGAAQSDAHSHNSMAYEDKLLLQLRVNRLANPKAHSQHPASSCQHLLQMPRVVRDDTAAGEIELATPFLYIESRGDAQVTLAGSYRHVLRRIDTTFAIRLKRVNLLQPDRPLPMLQLFI